MKAIIIILFLAFIASLAYSADVIQIATTRDAAEKFNNWALQAVTWDTIPVTDKPDPYPITMKALQVWYFPISDTEWLRATFTRTILGIYAIRWSHDGILWSEPGVCAILKPGKPQ